MAEWISPDGFVDTGGVWSDEPNGYDGDTGTYTYSPQNINAWQQPIRFTWSVPPTNVTKLRIWFTLEPEGAADWHDCQGKIYAPDDSSENIITAKFTEGEYVEFDVNTEHVVKYFWIRFEGQSVITGQHRIHEVQVYGDVGVPPKGSKNIVSNYYY